MDVGSTVVVNGHPYEVLEFLVSGEVQVKHIITGVTIWVDYFTARVIDPNREPGALLDALSAIDRFSEPPGRRRPVDG
ncbi:MAG: hypothetical protein AB7L09_02190 [Nitrospira sp.]